MEQQLKKNYWKWVKAEQLYWIFYNFQGITGYKTVILEHFILFRLILFEN